MINTTENARIYGRLFFFWSLSLKSSTNFGTVLLILSIGKSPNKLTRWKNGRKCKGKTDLNPFLVCYHETPEKNILLMDVVDITLLITEYRSVCRLSLARKTACSTACKRERTHDFVRRCWHELPSFSCFLEWFCRDKEMCKHNRSRSMMRCLWTAVIWS